MLCTIALHLWLVVLLLLLDGTVVIDKDKCVFIFGVLVALSALVAGAQIALLVVLGQCVLQSCLLLASAFGLASCVRFVQGQLLLPGALGPVG